MSVVYRDACADDARVLAAFCGLTWMDTFGALFAPADCDAYLAHHYGVAQQSAEIADAASHYQLATENGALIGYCWTGPLTLPIENGDGLELHRLYVVEAAKGQGVAQTLIRDARAWAAQQGAARLYLSVFERNARAQAFYRRNGFEVVDEHRIKVGETACRMLIMATDLT